MSAARERALLEAVRVRPNKRALAALKTYADAWDAAGGDGLESRLAANALRILLETHERIAAVLDDHGAAIGEL